MTESPRLVSGFLRPPRNQSLEVKQPRVGVSVGHLPVTDQIIKTREVYFGSQFRGCSLPLGPGALDCGGPEHHGGSLAEAWAAGGRGWVPVSPSHPQRPGEAPPPVLGLWETFKIQTAAAWGLVRAVWTPEQDAEPPKVGTGL